MMNRRNFIKNATGLLIAAPMVCKAENIMRIADHDRLYERFLDRGLAKIKITHSALYHEGDIVVFNNCHYECIAQHTKPGTIWVSES